jgi:hypothetical protein
MEVRKMGELFEKIFPSIPHYKIIDLMTKRVVGVADITKHCKDKEVIKNIISNAEYIPIYSREKLLRQLKLDEVKLRSSSHD